MGFNFTSKFLKAMNIVNISLVSTKYPPQHSDSYMWTLRKHIYSMTLGSLLWSTCHFICFYLNFDTHNQTAIFIPRLDELYAVHKKLNHSRSDSQ